MTVYLTRDAVMKTLEFVASLPSGSGIVFDYCAPLSTLPPAERTAMELMAQRAAGQGEPWRTFFDPATLPDEVQALGFSQAAQFGSAELNARYLAGRGDGLRLDRGLRMLSAHV